VHRTAAARRLTQVALAGERLVQEVPDRQSRLVPDTRRLPLELVIEGLLRLSLGQEA